MDYTVYTTNYLPTLATDPDAAEDIRGDAVFSLVPSTGTTPSVKGRPATKAAADGFVRLTDKIPEKSQLKGTEIYHGYLLGGVPAEGGEGGQGSVTPPETVQYTVTYKLNTPEGITITNSADFESIVVNAGGSHSVLEPQYTGDSASFVTWKDEAGIDVSLGTPLTVNSNITLTAQWNVVQKFTLSFDATGDLGHAPTNADKFVNQTLTEGSEYKEYLTPAFSGENALVDPNGEKTFQGWKLTDSDNNVINGDDLWTLDDTAILRITSDVKATAVWQIKQYTLTYSHGTVQIGTMLGSKTFNHGSDVTLDAESYGHSIGDIAESNGVRYVFKGWQLYKNNVEVDTPLIASDGKISGQFATSNLEVRTVWEKKATVKYTFNANGGTFANGSTTIEVEFDVGAMLVLDTIEKPTRAGATFKYWTDAASSTTQTTPSQEVGSEPKTFYAYWETTVKTVTVGLYDTWNEEVAGELSMTVTGGTLTKAAVDAAAAENNIQYWVSSGNVSVGDGVTKVRMNGSRLATTTAGAEELNPTYTTYTGSGNRYQCITTWRGMEMVSAIESPSGYPTNLLRATTLSQNYLMLNDVELPQFYNNSAYIWISLGWGGSYSDEKVAFTGVFDGAGHKISNIYQKDLSSWTYGGLFAINSGVIKNLNVYNDCCHVGSYAAGVVGLNEAEGKILSVNVRTGEIFTLQATWRGRAGGIAGQNNGLISDCNVSYSQVEPSKYGGLFAGYNAGTITNCTGGGLVRGANETAANGGYVGAGVGYNNGTVSNCNITTFTNNGSTYGTEVSVALLQSATQYGISYSSPNYTGGFCGYNEKDILNCHVTLYSVSGGVGAANGGFCGYNNTNGRIENCSVNVTGHVQGGNQTGGFVGVNKGTVEKSSVTVPIVKNTLSGTQSIGGFCGDLKSGAFRNCYSVVTTQMASKFNGTNTSRVAGFSVVTGSSTIENCYTDIGSITFNGNGNNSRYDVAIFGSSTSAKVTGSYVVTSKSSTYISRFTKFTSQTALVNAVKSTWSADIWDFSTNPLSLKPYAS